MNSEDLLQQCLEKLPSNFAQTQLQMVCTDASFFIVLSYYPESESGNFFLIQKDNILVDVILDDVICYNGNSFYIYFESIQNV